MDFLKKATRELLLQRLRRKLLILEGIVVNRTCHLCKGGSHEITSEVLRTEIKHLNQPLAKVTMQGNLIAAAYTLRVHIKTSSLWVEFINKNR